MRHVETRSPLSRYMFLLIYRRPADQGLEVSQTLYRAYSRNAILPRSFRTPHYYDQQGVALC